jgi:hypothetical protein
MNGALKLFIEIGKSEWRILVSLEPALAYWSKSAIDELGLSNLFDSLLVTPILLFKEHPLVQDTQIRPMAPSSATSVLMGIVAISGMTLVIAKF